MIRVHFLLKAKKATITIFYKNHIHKRISSNRFKINF